MEEIVINFWIYVDMGTGMAYNWSAKMYCMNGSDDEKFKLLKVLADYDYKTVERRPFSDKVSTKINGENLKGNMPGSYFNEYFEADAGWFVNELEQEMPKGVAFNKELNECYTFAQKLPQSPLYVLTHLIENEKGELRARTSQANIEWINKELERLKFMK